MGRIGLLSRGYVGALLLGIFPTGGNAGEPDGGCCSSSGCAFATAIQCIAQQGEYLGNAVECPPDGVCVGACCTGSQCTGQMSRQQCLAASGQYKGTGSTCNVSTCGAPCESDADCGDGNACNGNERCAQTTHRCSPRTVLNCADQNPCTNDLCNMATGCVRGSTGEPGCAACCARNGSCVPATELYCIETLQSTFRGPDTDCDDEGICVGPCCLSDTECVELEGAECFDRRGWFQTPGESCDDTDCTPSGACCGFGECRMVDEETCNRLESAFRGADTDCSDFGVCDGPCCFGGDACFVMSDLECWDSGAVFQGPWASECSPCACFKIGACCLSSGKCVIDWEYYCSGYREGTYVGGTCALYTCDCANDLECHDGNAANGTEFCDAGFCRGLSGFEYKSLVACLQGPEVAIGSACWCSDRNNDDRADLADVAVLFAGGSK